MIGRRRKAEEEERIREAARLTWTARRHGQDLVISLIGPKGGEGGLQRVPTPGVAELSPQAGTGVVEMVRSLTRARETGDTVAVESFAAPRPGKLPMTFTMSVALADVPFPETSELPDKNVSQVDMACGQGVRIERIVETDIGLEQPLPQFASTFLAPTDHGVLALAFATPNIGGGGAEAFADLFDTMALSCTIGPAG